MLRATAIVAFLNVYYAAYRRRKLVKQMDRSLARACAMKLIYEWEMGGDGGEETRLNLLEVKPDDQKADFMNHLATGVMENVETIDAKLAPYLRGWTIERLSRVDLAILRLAVYELILGENPAGVVINEAVELANQYSTDKAGAFVNGVLGNLARAMDDERAVLAFDPGGRLSRFASGCADGMTVRLW